MSTQALSEQNTYYRKDYRQHDFHIEKTELIFTLDKDKTRVVASLQLRRLHAGKGLVLDGELLDLRSVAIDDVDLSANEYTQDDKTLHIHKVPDTFTLRTEVLINPQANTALEGLYVSSNNFCTQCEAEGFRKITYYIDRPDNLSLFDVTIIANKANYPVLLSNGNLLEQGNLENGQHYAKWQDPFPKPSYLFALVAGDLALIQDTYITKSGKEVDCRIYVEAHNKDKCDYAMRSLKQAMRWDERTFGLEYDLDIYMIVAVDDFNMGAMENKGLNVFNSKFVLADSNTATDVDYQGIEAVIAHEYFHNWTGNRVTCRDWFQLSLKEGLTVFRDQEFSSDMCDRAVKRIQDVRLLRTHQFAEDAGPMAHPIRPDSYREINNFYTLTVYEKGAEVIRMQHTLLGKDGFRKGMDVYFDRHDGQAVTCDDFVSAMETGGNQDLQQFSLWYSQAGTPRIDFSDTYDAATQQYQLSIKQHTPSAAGQVNKADQADKKAMVIPINMALLDSNGEQLLAQQVILTANEETVVFDNISSHPVPSLMRGFSAPVNYQYEYSIEQLALLAQFDQDSFARWEAMQRLSLEAINTEQQSALNLLADVYESILIQASEEKLEPAFAAELLSLPSERYIAEQQKQINPDAIHASRERLMTYLAKTHHDLLREIYTQFNLTGDYSPDAESVAYRSLRNQSLAILSRLSDKRQDIVDLIVSQYRQANNMTDRMAALNAIAAMDGALRDDIIDDFYQQFAQENLVVDKWFSVQASTAHPQSVERVKTLMQHQAFSIKVPNKVRALIGAFVNGNPTGFHQADGAGYTLLKETVLSLDKLNPQVASRMVSAFNQWKRYDENRQQLMRENLQLIAAETTLSNDVSEIVNKALGQ